MHTSFFDALAIRLIQAPMAGSQNHVLAAAVFKAGGLGSIPAAMLNAEQLHKELTAFQVAISSEAPSRPTWDSLLPLNVNFFCHTPPQAQPSKEAAWRLKLHSAYQSHGIDPETVGSGPGRAPFSEESLALMGQFKPAVVSFHFGLPKPEWVQQLKAWGMQIWSSATTVEEAQWLERHGADAVIAQGLEAGGHRGMFLTDDLSTQVGTAFLTSHEATTSALHRQALMSERARHTALTNLFSGRPARGIVNKFMQDFGPLNAEVPDFPLATAAVAPLRAVAEAQGSGDYSPLWSGQNASDCEVLPAADIAHKLLQAWA